MSKELLVLEPREYSDFFFSVDIRLKELPLDSALALVAELKANTENLSDVRIPYYFGRTISRLFKAKKKYHSADSVLQQTLLYTQEQQLNYEEPETLKDLGDLYSDIYKYSESIDYLKQAYQLYYKWGYIRLAALMQSKLGLISYHAKEGNSVPYFLQAIHLGKDSLTKRELINDYNSIGMVYEEGKQYQRSIDYYKKALTLATTYKDSVWIGLTMGNIGQVLVLTGKYDEAMAYLVYDLNSSIHYNELASAASTARSIAEIYLHKNQRSMGLYYLQKGLELALKGHGTTSKKKIYLLLSEFYEQEKAFQKAHYYLKLFTQINDSLAHHTQEIEAIKIQSAFDLQKHRSAITTLQILTQKKDQLYIGLGIVIILVAATTILGLRIMQKVRFNKLLLHQKRELQERNTMLQQQQEEIEAQNEELFQSREEIEAQRDILTIQNQDLYQAHDIIALQNEEIRTQNQTLEEEVRKRTHKLLEYNHHLEELAFMTAHNLRTPVARILGLGEVLRFSEPEEERMYIEKLIGTTKELDLVLKDMNAVLEKKKGPDAFKEFGNIQQNE
ncbi:tetratricopeptide repeat protein [Cytophagaceae bacterium YF14B1]|uniref:Tetratricopeptide repeat protein n=1 Tax=Xanthocytophaga flava TaxID=3048013 RepID=A0AAE3QXL2_9BACT|nr:tetratricopeptide repeat protein [Xanthocytophaga flavus]MDJ1485081.1 tetratricopeptide repeat protein [Xanthocytophaga flavus]